MIGVSENFPKKIHRFERYETTVATKKIQKKLVQILEKINRKTFSFEEITHPTIPNCKIIFETGLAEEKTFNYIDEVEKIRFLKALKKETFNLLDFFISIRYYRIQEKKSTPLNFDYYLIRIIFDKKTIEAKVFHERGPRYISPEDLITFIINDLNKNSTKKVIKSKMKII
ncbi:MAG: hypothetical protein NWF10_00925 [Candidatus Bathyarchaeota archaeon]|nr:hypothetical protein [Candidatus Bathyarchaeota archaeon]